jgi:MFS transporter, UMF1 family
MSSVASALPVPIAPVSPRLLSGRVLAWALYDLGNTIFSMNIVTLYLALWVVNHLGGSDATWGYVNSASMLLLFFTAPFLGALSDHLGRRLPLLLVSTLVCVAFTLLLGAAGLGLTLAIFFIANYAFQGGLVFYDATLPLVSTPANRGRVGGLGVGLGYIGSFIGVAVGLATLDSMGFPFVFRMTALLFFVFALPIFLVVHEPKPLNSNRISVRAVAGRVRETVRGVGRFPELRRFLIGRVFYADAANTLIIFMGVYVTNELGFTERAAQILSLSAIVGAVIGGLSFGHVVDRIGPKRSLNVVLLLWMAVLAAIILVPVLGLPGSLFWPIAVLVGTALGGTWASDRPYMLLLSPPDRIGEFYGLYSMVGRFAAVVGPALWAFIADTLGLGRPAAVAGLLAMVVVAFCILKGVDETPAAVGLPAAPAQID